MAVGYTRQSSFSDGDTITAALFNNEYNQLLNALAYSTSDSSSGHRHDGTAAQGGAVPVIGDLDFLNKVAIDTSNNRVGVFVEVSSAAVEQIRVQDGAIVPVTDNDIDLGTSSLEFKNAYFDGIVTTDSLVADTADINGGTVDGAIVGGSSAAAGSFTTLAASGAITGSDTVQGTTITATTAFVPDASDGAALGTTSLEFSDLYLADGAVVYFGDDQDVSLTHVADTGLLLSSTDQLQFGDSGTYIHQSADGVLDLVSDTEIELTATTIDINGAVDVSGEIIAASLDISGNVDIDGTTNLDAVDIDGAVQIDATVTVGVDDTGYDVKFFGDAASAYMLWDASVDDLILGGAARVVVPDGQLVLGSTAVSSTAAELNILDGKSFVDEDDMSSDSATAIASQQSIKAYVDSQAGDMQFVLEDGDGTEVQITKDKEVKFVEGGGIDIDWTDTDNGTDGDPYDLTFTINAAQTGITSIYATDLILGEDSQTAIDFGTVNEIDFKVDNAARLTLTSSALYPVTTNQIDLGTSSLEFKDAFFDGTVTADAFAGPLTGDVTGNASGTAATVTGAAQSNITSLGTLTTLTVDNVIINGTTIGHTDDTDLLTLASGGLTASGTITVGVDDTGHDVKFFGDTASAYMLWDASADDLILGGAAGLDVDGVTNLDNVDIDGTVQIDGATTFGVDDTGVDVKFFGATASAYLLWDESADKLLTAGNTFVDIVKDKLMIGGTAVTTTAAELNKLDGAGTLKQAGLETIYVPAAAMYPNSTNGCADLEQVELSNGPELKCLDFDASSDENAQFTVAFPKSWNEGTVTFQAFFTVTGTNTGTVAWGLSGGSTVDDGSINTAFGTNVVATAKAHSGTSNDMDVSAVSGAVTIANAAADSMTFFQIMRDVSADDQSGDARLLGIKLFFTTDAANDA